MFLVCLDVFGPCCIHISVKISTRVNLEVGWDPPFQGVLLHLFDVLTKQLNQSLIYQTKHAKCEHTLKNKGSIRECTAAMPYRRNIFGLPKKTFQLIVLIRQMFFLVWIWTTFFSTIRNLKSFWKFLHGTVEVNHFRKRNSRLRGLHGTNRSAAVNRMRTHVQTQRKQNEEGIWSLLDWRCEHRHRHVMLNSGPGISNGVDSGRLVFLLMGL